MLSGIYITKSDKERLIKLIEDAKYKDFKTDQYLRVLEAEIDKAKVIEDKAMPKDVITMNSRVLLSMEGTEEEFTLVYPKDADVKNNKISVFSPIGTAILGYREGSSIEWKVPNGVVEIKVVKVLSQPSYTEELRQII